MKLNTALDIPFRYCKLPNRAIELLGRKSSTRHRKPEVLTRDLPRLVILVGGMKEGAEESSKRVCQLFAEIEHRAARLALQMASSPSPRPYQPSLSSAFV
jgi:hypothetical protein